jgi:hypothetical protein
MAKYNLTDRQFDLLKAVLIYTAEHERGPTTSWLAQYLQVGLQGISNHKSKLVKDGLLRADVNFASITPKAKQLLEELAIVTPTRLPVLGQVKAGRTRPEDIEVNMEITDLNQLDSIDAQTIQIAISAIP